MTSKQLNTFKLGLFFAGLVLIAVLFMIVNLPLPEEGLSKVKIFLWINITVMYLAFSCPLFFSSICSRNLDSKVPPLIIVWFCVLVFNVTALVLAFFTSFAVFSVKTSVIIELVLAFLCAVSIYFGYFAGFHVQNVQAGEEELLSKTGKVKDVFSSLELQVNTWDVSLTEQKQKVKRLCDDVKYLSPAGKDASAIEAKLIEKASLLMEADIQDKSELDKKISEIEVLINQRKLIRR